MRLVTTVVAVLALSLVGVGCGGGDDEATEDTVDTLTLPTTTDETDGSDLGAFASGECLELVSAGLALSQAFTAASSGAGDLEETSELFDRLVDKAPAEIRADLQTLAGFYSEYVEVLKDLDLQAGQVPSGEDLQKLQSALASIDQPELQAASERLSAWAETNCPGG
ncbi:MAG TPA: hypothetical protein VK926_00030 [Gaiellaceae bacterium]|nr:hypothetical protein [Gaiellaceae bacterium]